MIHGSNHPLTALKACGQDTLGLLFPLPAGSVAGVSSVSVGSSAGKRPLTSSESHPDAGAHAGLASAQSFLTGTDIGINEGLRGAKLATDAGLQFGGF